MVGNSAQEIKTIFLNAIDERSGVERAEYLDRACGDDTELRRKIEALLTAHKEAGEFFDPSAFGPDVALDGSALTEGPGTVIGRYKLLERIGEGGMAVVYMAEQEQPIRRKVALKIIKLGMDTKQVIARFEAERQALAMMDHPNIAKVLDAGATETGRPYFVMELVTGVSITEYCDQNNLSTKERLELFVQVCHAVQHAHQKGIIHRDIKPSNVMVTMRDGVPVPKVIDFGIAKATNQRLTEKTLFTRYAHIIGTPAYMSPEQAELSDLGIDSRSDIYSLGVLLYELLTGTTPFSEEELRKAGYLEMQRIIREEEPIKPSTKLSTLGETLTDIAKRRGCTPDLLRRAVRGDLDWIVMKALEKDRARRYEGASGLAFDIQRHLEHRPVAAHAPSAAYRLRKFLRRNRLQVGAVLAVAVVASTVIISFLWNRHQVRLAEAEVVRQVNDLAEARKLVNGGDLTAARQLLVPILESDHAGLEARVLFRRIMGNDANETPRITAIMDKHHRERVQYYTRQIEADPTDPNHYLRRAQQFKYLRDEDNVHADMSRYAAILGQGWFSRLRFGTPEVLKVVRTETVPYRLVFSVGRRDNGIIVASIAFGQKGRSTMKPFEIPMFLTSLLTLCLFPGLDMQPVHADFNCGMPTLLGPGINSPDGSEMVRFISSDGLEMYLDWGSPAWGHWDICVSRRVTTDSDWGPPENLGTPVNTQGGETCVFISADGLSLYSASNRTGTMGQADIWVANRLTKQDPWGEPVNLGPAINSTAWDGEPWLSPDGKELYFVSFRTAGYGNADVWVARRETEDAPWGEPVNLGPPVNSAYDEWTPSLSPDGLLLFFSDHEVREKRPGGYGDADMWVSRRATVHDNWGTPVNLGPMVNGPYREESPRLSPDGRMLYFSSRNRPENYGRWDIWQAPVLPVIDFNGDGKADGKDVVILTEHWGESDSVCDIGPYAWGDGIVDEQDLFALAEYLPEDPDEEYVDPTLVAHWALDEGAGSVAIDWAGQHYAMIVGDVVWEPNGVVDGALAFDGQENFMRTVDSILDPATGPLSVIAWVKGGGPNRVIVSQFGGADWLYLNQYGMLTTDLKASGQDGTSLTSDAWLLDDHWHRVALVWDGTNRALRVDGVEVATDTQPNLAASSGSLQIGTGKGRAADTFWSGLMDDIRVYRRATRP